jgi:cation-transporting ATPase E
VDAGFGEAAATLGAQTGLSTFVSLASILLILFLEPPSRLFSSWAAPSPDRRPTILVVVLIAVVVAVLFTPALSGYFGLTHAVQPVYTVVLPALVVWFLALSAAYRLRLLDRVLGLGDLPLMR